MSMTSSRLAWIAMLMLACASVGCAHRPAVLLDENFAAHPPKTITLMPSIDGRLDKTGHHIKDLQKVTQKFIERQLKRQKYSVVRAEQYAGSPPEAQLAEMTDPELAKLGPGDGNPMFIFVLQDIDVDYAVIAKTVKFEGRAMLLEPGTGRVLWKDQEAGSVGQGGLISGLIPMGDLGVQQCIANMMLSLPKQTGVKK